MAETSCAQKLEGGNDIGANDLWASQGVDSACDNHDNWDNLYLAWSCPTSCDRCTRHPASYFSQTCLSASHCKSPDHFLNNFCETSQIVQIRGENSDWLPDFTRYISPYPLPPPPPPAHTMWLFTPAGWPLTSPSPLKALSTPSKLSKPCKNRVLTLKSWTASTREGDTGRIKRFRWTI